MATRNVTHHAPADDESAAALINNHLAVSLLPAMNLPR